MNPISALRIIRDTNKKKYTYRRKFSIPPDISSGIAIIETLGQKSQKVYFDNIHVSTRQDKLREGSFNKAVKYARTTLNRRKTRNN